MEHLTTCFSLEKLMDFESDTKSDLYFLYTYD